MALPSPLPVLQESRDGRRSTRCEPLGDVRRAEFLHLFLQRRCRDLQQSGAKRRWQPEIRKLREKRFQPRGLFHAQSRKSDEGRDSGGLKSIDVFGGSYQFNDALSAAFYASDVEDVVKRQYVSLNYTMPIASNSLNFDFNGYRSKYDEDFYDSETGKFNLVESGLLTYAHGQYFGLGKKLGKFGFSVEKKKKKAKK